MTCNTQNTSKTNFDLIAPLSGKIHPIEKSADQVFANKMIGDGFIIDPSSNCVVAPCDGVITQLHQAKHTIAIRNQDIEILIHIGIDTVQLNGTGFTAKVTLKDNVKLGQPLIYFDSNEISKHANLQTVIMITTGQTGNIAQADGSYVEAGKTVAFSVQLNSSKQTASKVATLTTTAQASREIILLNPQGLHARPAAKLVQSVNAFDAEINIVNNDNGKQASITSLTELLELNTKCGSKLLFQVQAENPSKVLDAIEIAIANGLGEKIEDIQPITSYADEQPLISWGDTDASHIIGISATKGIAIGNVIHQYHSFPELPEQGKGIDEELGQLAYGINKSQDNLEELISKLKNDATSSHEDIFVAHKELLHDPAIRNATEKLIKQGKSAVWSWYNSYLAKSQKLKNLDNPLLVARADDIEDVGSRVLRVLIGMPALADELPANTVLFLDNITLSEIISLNNNKIVAICTIEGGATSHAAILASSLNIPYIAATGNQIRQVKAGNTVIVDANKGLINIAPTDKQIEDFSNYKNKLIEINKNIAANKNNPAVTTDGKRVLVAANIASLDDVKQAKNLGADGIGLTRTEFIFMNRMSCPTIAEQQDIYKTILEKMAGNDPIVIRTLDAGGDKAISYLPINKEDNPFLGERGIRVGIFRPSILRDQIKALLASATDNLNIMLPMVSSILELRAVKEIIAEEKNKLQQETTSNNIKVKIGIMVEVPSVAIIAEQFAKEVDFFSIGSNDLIQYTLAVDRGHAKLAKWGDGLDPAVLHLINNTIIAAKKHGKWVGICGNMATDIVAIPILVGLGIGSLSVSTNSIPFIKQRIRELDFAFCKKLAEQALTMESAKQVRNLIESSEIN